MSIGDKAPDCPTSGLPLRAFWHVWLVNNWPEVVTEQLRIVTGSGLAEVLDGLRVSLCGDLAARDEFRAVIRESPFIQIACESDRPGRFEYPALEILYRWAVDCGERQVVMYFHTKGISYADDRYARWRAILNDGVISQWRAHVSAIMTGADVSGQNYLNGTFRPHFSGNFWFSHSQYIAKLRSPSQLNQRDRHEAETWICSHPHRVHAMPFVEPN